MGGPIMASANSIDHEAWLPVLGWEKFYDVSSHGRVRVKDRYAHNGIRRGKIRKLKIANNGYLQVALENQGIKVCRSVAGLVAAAFIGERPNKYQVNHKDGDKKNN